MEDEGRLRNIRIRDHFLTRILSNADFHETRVKGRLKDLLRFHDENRYMLDAHSRTLQDALELLIRQHKEEDTGLLYEQ